MKTLVDRLNFRGIDESTSTELSVMFGSTGSLARSISNIEPLYRVGLWPLVSTTEPLTAMGIMSVLGYLLDQWQDVRVYRIFARIEEGNDPNSYTWDINSSQFTIDDWAIEDLGENVAISGSCEHNEAGWTLTLEIENDLLENEGSSKQIVIKTNSLQNLLLDLPAIAKELAQFLTVYTPSELAFYYHDLSIGEEELSSLLHHIFYWELHLFLSLWGRAWNNSLDEFTTLLQKSSPAKEFGAWLCIHALKRSLLPNYSPVYETLINQIDVARTTFEQYAHITTLGLSDVLFRLRMTAQAYLELETYIKEAQSDTNAWKALIGLYKRSGRINEAIGAYQQAIEADAADDILYSDYGDLMVILDYEKWQFNDFILIQEDMHADGLIWEAIAAYKAALNLNPKNIEALFKQTVQYVELFKEAEVYNCFEALLRLDTTKAYVRTIIEMLYNFDDIDPAIKLLSKQVLIEPELVQNHINIAIAYLDADDLVSAKKAIETARGLTKDAQVRTDIDRLMLSIDNPDFEVNLGEIIDIISAGNSLDDDDVDFLEAAVAAAPSFAEGYLLLAKAYTAWDDDAAALETLLDGQKYLPHDVDILEQLSRLLWKLDEKELALDYLNKGLKTHPRDVNLLSLTGWYLFQEDQDEQARVFLGRAEALNPRNVVFKEVREAIARTMN